MTSYSYPQTMPLDAEGFAALAGAERLSRRLSQVRDAFHDQAAADQILAANDPLVYEFAVIRRYDSGGRLSFGITTIFPGTVGGEYYMTKGHFHDRKEDGDELYQVLSGEGMLLLQQRDGTTQEMPFKAGPLYYTPAAWAHRTINTGSQPLVFLSVWAADTQYDYEEIGRRGGFPRLVTAGPEGPTLVENPSFSLRNAQF